MEQRLDILNKANDLFLKYGIKSVTMDDISRHLGVSKKTLYQFVENKNDLINRCLAFHVEEEQRAINEIVSKAKDPIDEMLSIAKFISKMLREMNPSVIYDLQKYYGKIWEMLESFHIEYIYKIIFNNIQKGIELGLYRDNLHADIIAKFYVRKSQILTDESIFPTSKYNKEALYLEFISYHIHGVASTKGLKLLNKYLLERNQQ